MALTERRIIIAGCGPGSAEYVTPAARQAARSADILVGASRLLDLFPESRARRIPMGADIEEALSQVEGLYRDKQVTVLVTGDPGLFSLAKPVIQRFGASRCFVIPGVSSVQAAFARIGLDWADATIVSAHDRDPEVDAACLAHADKVAILGGREASIRWIARTVSALGKGYRIFVCENLTLEDEKVHEVAPDGLDGLQVSSRTIVLLIREGLRP